MKAVLLAASLLAVPAAALAQAQPPDINPAHVKSGTYQVEPSHTRILFAVSHMGFTTWYGEFTKTAGTLTLDPSHPSKSKLAILIQTGSVSTSNSRLDGELVGPEWFDASSDPTISFVSTAVMPTGANAAKVTGNLTFHGVTKPITLSVKFNGAGINPIDKKYTAGFEVSGDLKRSDYGVKTYVPMIGDDVKLMISASFEHE